MKLGQLFKTLQIALRSRWRLVVLAFITLLFCIFVFPRIARPAVTPESHLPGLSLEQWRSQSPISRRSQDSLSPEELLQKAHELQIEGYYRSSCKLLLKALEMNLSDTEFERLIRDEYPEAEVEEDVQKLFPVEPETPFRATTLRRLGDVLRTMGSLEPSRIVLMQSLEIAEQFADSEETSAIHFSLGNTYRALGKRAQIIEEGEDKQIKKKEYDDRSLSEYEKAIAQSSNASLKLRAKLSKLSLLVEIKPDRDVISLANDVKSTLESLEPNLETVYAHLDLAQSLTCLNVKHTRTEFEYPQPPIVNLCQSDSAEVLPAIEEEDMPRWDEIVQLLVTAEKQAEELGDARSQSYALGNLGEVYEVQQQFYEATATTEKAATIATQSNQLGDILYRWEWQLGRLGWKVNGDRKDILAAYSSTFTSLENLQQNLGSLNADIQFNFRDEVEPAYRQFVDVLLQNAPGIAEPSQDNLKQAREVIEALQIAELNNFFREACLQPKTKEADNVDPNAAIIYSIILRDRLEVIISFSDGKLENHQFSVNSQIVNEVAERFQLHLKQTEPDDDGNQKYTTEAKILYEWLIEPFTAHLSTHSIKTLVFVSDGLLRNIPMTVLSDGTSLLIEKYNISVNSSLKLIEPRPLGHKIQKILLAGASNAPSFRTSKPAFPPLAYIREEFAKISSSFSSQIIFEEKFTDRELQDSITEDNFQVIHIATHGKFSSNAENTFILTYNNRLNSRKINQLIQVKEQNFSNPIEMLVLSACETAQGDRRAALGLAGVAMRAGARSTLATLWKVDDRATAEFMGEFYSQLKQNQNISKAEALRLSQLFLRKQTRYSHPYYWAAFVLLGNWL